ncbi:MAG: hypothetical protein IT457_11125 [Planctomycetes bacterium]|nr:hypothetical protein [Planctomycetota bacterium]
MSIAPGPDDPVADDESLLRSIDGDLEHRWESGRLRLASTSFNDRGMKPSVDRERLRGDALDARKKPDDGLARFATRDVRAIDLGDIDPSTGQIRNSIPVDVVPDPIRASLPAEENLAHALIQTRAQVSDKKFRRLKERLARLAERDIVQLPAKYRDVRPSP